MMKWQPRKKVGDEEGPGCPGRRGRGRPPVPVLASGRVFPPPRPGRGGRRRELYFARQRLSRRAPPGTPTGSGGAGSAAGPGLGRPSGRFLIWLLGCGGAGGARSAAEPAGAAARCPPLPRLSPPHPRAVPARAGCGPSRARWLRVDDGQDAPLPARLAVLFIDILERENLASCVCCAAPPQQ